MISKKVPCEGCILLAICIPKLGKHNMLSRLRCSKATNYVNQGEHTDEILWLANQIRTTLTSYKPPVIGIEIKQ